MQVLHTVLRDLANVANALNPLSAIEPHLVLVFGSVAWLQALAPQLAAQFGLAQRMGCTIAGEISNEGVSVDSCVVTAVRFERTAVRMASTPLSGMQDSLAAGQRLAQALPLPGLRAVLVLGQGVNINGSQLIGGMAGVLGEQVLITGGLAGDGTAFKETWVLAGTEVHNDQVVCVGLYGEALNVTHGSFGGWMPLGPARNVTRSYHDVLYELDGEPALDVYKRYLGEHAGDLPASGLLFPFAILGRDHADVGLIRTISAVDDAEGSLTLAGDIVPECYLRLMHASTDALIGGAETAAQAAKMVFQSHGKALALLVSCVGRKLVMGGRVNEEVEAVADVLSRAAVMAGFYSYGEISPLIGELPCKLHNQTMTITGLIENSADCRA